MLFNHVIWVFAIRADVPTDHVDELLSFEELLLCQLFCRSAALLSSRESLRRQADIGKEGEGGDERARILDLAVPLTKVVALINRQLNVDLGK